MPLSSSLIVRRGLFKIINDISLNILVLRLHPRLIAPESWSGAEVSVGFNAPQVMLTLLLEDAWATVSKDWAHPLQGQCLLW